MPALLVDAAVHSGFNKSHRIKSQVSDFYLIKRAGIIAGSCKNFVLKYYFALANLALAAAAFFTFSVARSAEPNGLSFAKSTNIGAATKIDE